MRISDWSSDVCSSDLRHAVVGREFQEVGLELLALGDIDRLDRVGDAGFLEKQRDLVAVRGRPVIEIDHLGYSVFADSRLRHRRPGGNPRRAGAGMRPRAGTGTYTALVKHRSEESRDGQDVSVSVHIGESGVIKKKDKESK